MNYFSKTKAFSLIEILFSLIIISVIVIFSISGLQEYQQKREIKLYAKALCHDLKWARIEAVLLNQAVKITPSNNNWCNGWLVFSDVNSSNNKNILKQQAGLDNCKIKFNSFPRKNYFRFLPEGISDYQNGSYYFYLNTQLLAKIIISQIGRVRFE